MILAAISAIAVGTGNSMLLGISNTAERVLVYENDLGAISNWYLPFGKYASILPEGFTFIDL